MHFLKYGLSLWILAGILSMGTLGCAARSAQQFPATSSEYRKMMERQRAKAALQEPEIPKIPEMNAEGYEKLGDRYLAQGNLDLAFAQYQRSLDKEPQQIRVRYKIALLFLKKGLLEEAEKEFQDILKSNRHFALALEGMGRVCFQKGQMREAEGFFREASQIDPALWQSRNFLGIIYDRQGKVKAAAAEYRAAIAQKPNIGFLWNNLGISLLLSGETEKAVEAFQEALRVGPPQQKVYNNLALAQAKLERFSQALEALKMRGDESLAYYDLGCIYMMLGKNREALESFEKAIELRPAFYAEAHEKAKKARAAMVAGNR